MNTTTIEHQIEPNGKGRLTLREAVQDFEGQLIAREQEYAPALPPQIKPDRFRAVVVTAVNLNPDLLRADRRSLFNAALKAAQDGLLPDGREGALVIFNTKEKDENGQERYIKKCQWLPMVFGIIKKARQSGEIMTLAARIIYENEVKSGRFRFTIEDGEDKLVHDPILFEDRGPPIGVYARVKFKDGSIDYEILNKAEVEKIRSVSRAKDSGPWRDWAEEMWKKSAIRRLGKRLPLSPDLQTTLARDDELSEYEQIKQSERSRMSELARSQLGAPIEGETIEADEGGEGNRHESRAIGNDGGNRTAGNTAPPAAAVPEVTAGDHKPKRGRPPKAPAEAPKEPEKPTEKAPPPPVETKPKIETAMERGCRLLPLTRTVADVTDLQQSIGDEIAPSEVTAWALACSKRARELG